MKVVLQTVTESKLSIDGNVFSSISRGYVLLVGFTEGDNLDIVQKMANKIVGLRLFMDENGKTNLSLADVDGEILSVSQFTLYADCVHGRRPSFINALHPSLAKPLYEEFNKELFKLTNKEIKTGVFGADMKVNLINDGPFTLVLDSKELF